MSTGPLPPQVLVAKDYEVLCETVVEQILSLALKQVTDTGRFTFVLSGGKTPRRIYELMAGEPYRDRFPWKGIHFFWGDERWVPPEDPRSNYSMIADLLLTKVEIPFSNIHPIKTFDQETQASAEPSSAAELYEKEILSFFGHKAFEFPRFDLILLGLGQDGHVASLFPEGDGLDRKLKRLAVAVSKGAGERRITLTLGALNRAEHIFFLVYGDEKSQVLRDVLTRKDPKAPLPAQEVKPERGRVVWFVDQLAAANLE